MKRRLFVMVASLLISACSHAFESKPLQIVFVCQHGYAKSLVAALHFQRKAEAFGLSVQVVARGVTPAPVVPPAIIAALKSDGFDVATYQPVALTVADIEAADRIISFGVDVPDSRGISTRIDDVPALSEDYAKGRNRIVETLDSLLAELLTAQHLIETD